MKKTCACLLAVCLLLTLFAGCELPFELPGEKPQETAEPTSEGGEKPRQGEHVSGGVWVDDSYYTPRDHPAPVYTRLREDRIEGLAPGDYGLLLPFPEPAHSQYLAAFHDYRYGFTTASGQIVCDSFYQNVFPLTYTDADGVFRVLPVWVLQGSDYLYGAAALDGSFVLPCKFWSIEGFSGGLIARHKDDVFSVYDLSGAFCFDTGALPRDFQRDCETLTAVGDCFRYEIRDWEGRRETKQHWLLNRKGEILIGPCADIGIPAEGLVPVSEEEGNYGYMDLAGNWVIEPGYVRAKPFCDGIAVVWKAPKAYVIDREGKVLYSENYIDFVLEEGLIIADRGNTGYGLEVLDRDWNRLLIKSYPDYADRIGHGVFAMIDPYCGAPLQIWNARTGGYAEIPDVTDLNPDRSTYISLYTTYMNDRNQQTARWDRWILVRGKPCMIGVLNETKSAGNETSRTGRLLLTEDLEILDQRYGVWLSFRPDPAAGEFCPVWSSGGGQYEVDGTDGEILYEGTSNAPLYTAGGYVVTADDYGCTIQNAAGEVVFLYPFTGAWDD